MLQVQVDNDDDEDAPEEQDTIIENAKLAVDILEQGLARARCEREENLMLPYTNNSDDDEAFDLSQSSVVDAMSSADALAILGDKACDKQDRKQLIHDLRAALVAAGEGA